MRLFCLIILTCLIPVSVAFPQEINFKSIHQEQSEYYAQFKSFTENQFDSLQRNIPDSIIPSLKKNSLNKTIFGYQPYWGGSAYLSYQWDLLSDLCYFSYEVDPATGNPATTHNWMTTSVIDSAKAHNVNVHLCITLFSNHALFFQNPNAWQTLIDSVINLVDQREAMGVNINFEAVSSSVSIQLNEFIIELTNQVHDALPGSVVSVAVPAVDWNEIYNIPLLNEFIDLFMIMGYDYYWNGSSQAGPVDGLYSMTNQYNYNLSRTLSWYQFAGASRDKIILGLPYYGRVWGTQGPHPPSYTTVYGQALTYYQVRSNYSGYYSNENKFWEQNSFSPYFSFQTTGWNQCFIDDVNSLAKRYDMVNQRGLAGIGIWALGYDRGYTDLWELIQNKFTAGPSYPCNDTIYDSGGPTFDYYNNENYSLTIAPTNSISLSLTFLSFELEPGYDLLRIFDGPDTLFPLIGSFTGDNGPGIIHASDNSLTLQVISDQATTRAGWKALVKCSPFQIGISENEEVEIIVKLFPNPVNNDFHLQFHLKIPTNLQIFIIDLFGNRKGIITDGYKQPGFHSMHLSPADYGIKTSGVYFLRIYSNGMPSVAKKWLYLSPK